MTSKVAVYAGTFDPVTRGHVDIAQKAQSMFDTLVFAVGENPAKRTLFTRAERMLLIQAVVPGASIMSFDGLLAKFCAKGGVNVIVRGLRALTDFEYELAMAHANKTQAPGVETVFIPTSPELSFVSSSAAKEIAKYGGDVLPFVHPAVCDALRKKFFPSDVDIRGGA
jgi:pantetheine-phosphate adenylyltransferase